MRHLAKFRGGRSNCYRDIAIFKLAAVRHLGFVMPVGTIHEEHLVVFIVVQNVTESM